MPTFLNPSPEGNSHSSYEDQDVVIARLEELAARAELAEALNDSSIDRIMALDASWRIIAWNKTNAFLSDISREESVGKHLFEVLPHVREQAEIVEAIQQALLGRTVFVPSGKGSYPAEYYENHFIPLKDKNGAIAGVLNIMHNVAHRIKAEDELKKLNKSLKLQYRELERVSNELLTFTHITSNDLKEPLQHVYAAIEKIISTEALKLSNSGRASLRKIQAAVRKMNLLTDDILALTSINNSPGHLRKVNMNAVVEQAMQSLSAKITEKHAKVNLPSLPVVTGNKDQLVQLFYHLLDNALKFQRPGNIPEINIGQQEVSREEAERLGLFAENQYINISVRDNGIGFEPDALPHLFRMFGKLHSQKEYKGTGKGLAICKKIIDAHQGYITAESKPGQGTTFCCYLPVNAVAG